MAPALMAVSAVASLAGGAMAAKGQRMQGKAAQQQAEYEARIKENEAVAAGHNARGSIEQAERQVRAMKAQRDLAIGSDVSAIGKSGITLSGSALDLLNFNSTQMENDISEVRYQGQLQAHNFGQEAVGARSSAASARFSGATARNASRMAARGTMIGAVGSAAGMAAGAFSGAAKSGGWFKN